MAENPLPQPNFSVCFEPENSLIRINWTGKVSEKELKIGYETALEILKQNPVQRILIDLAERQLEVKNSPDNMFETLFNQALALVKNTLFLAMVVTPEEFYLTTEISRFGNYEKSVNDHIIIERFLTLSDAETWLAAVGESGSL